MKLFAAVAALLSVAVSPTLFESPIKDGPTFESVVNMAQILGIEGLDMAIVNLDATHDACCCGCGG